MMDRALRSSIRERAGRRCEYCQLHEDDADFLHCLLDKRGLSNSTTTCDLCEEPMFAIEHSLQIRKLFPSTVELPIGHAPPREIKPPYQNKIKLLYLNRIKSTSTLL